MSENEKNQDTEQGADEEVERTKERARAETNPAEGPGPRGNEEVDPERLQRDEEDLDRTLGR